MNTGLWTWWLAKKLSSVLRPCGLRSQVGTVHCKSSQFYFIIICWKCRQAVSLHFCYYTTDQSSSVAHSWLYPWAESPANIFIQALQIYEEPIVSSYIMTFSFMFLLQSERHHWSIILGITTTVWIFLFVVMCTFPRGATWMTRGGIRLVHGLTNSTLNTYFLDRNLCPLISIVVGFDRLNKYYFLFFQP